MPSLVCSVLERMTGPRLSCLMLKKQCQSEILHCRSPEACDGSCSSACLSLQGLDASFDAKKVLKAFKKGKTLQLSSSSSSSSHNMDFVYFILISRTPSDNCYFPPASDPSTDLLNWRRL